MTQQINIRVKDGEIKATILEESETPVERIMLYLIKGAYAAQKGRVVDNTDVIPREIKDIFIKQVVR